MKIVLAPDSFKGSLSAPDVCAAMEAGARRALPGAHMVSVPLADGGEGTLDCLVSATGGRVSELSVTGPLGDRVQARYGMLGDGRTAVVEMAEAAGLTLLAPDRLDPLRATTRGVGELVRAAALDGASRVLVCLGGSATNDGGAGFAQALGVHLLDAAGRELPPGGEALRNLAQIDASGVDPRVAACEIVAACDVDTPLCGPDGASHVFGPQKGASPDMVEQLAAALAHYADVIARDLRRDVRAIPGAGAAGGLGAGLLAFCGARLQSGADLVLEAVAFRSVLAGARLVLTGEGRCDGQSARGKVVSGVARAAKAAGVPVMVLAGALGPGYEALYEEGLTAAFAIADGPLALDDALARTPDLLARAAESVVRLFAAGR